MYAILQLVSAPLIHNLFPRNLLMSYDAIIPSHVNEIPSQKYGLFGAYYTT